MTKVDSLVLEQLLADENELFSEIEAISLKFDRKNEGYRHSSWLVYIATKCVKHEADVAAFTLGAGQGKTFVALLLAEYYSEQNDSVAIIVPN